MDDGSAPLAAAVDEDPVFEPDAVLEPDDEHAATTSVAAAMPKTAVVLSLRVTIMEPYSFVGVR
jgi:hypothetical protein